MYCKTFYKFIEKVFVYSFQPNFYKTAVVSSTPRLWDLFHLMQEIGVSRLVGCKSFKSFTQVTFH